MTNFIDDKPAHEHKPEREYDGLFAIESDGEDQDDAPDESSFDDDEDEEDEYEKDNREGWEHNIEKWNEL